MTTNTSRPASGTDPAEIAQRLTPPQKKAMTNPGRRDGRLYLTARQDVERRLTDMGLAYHPPGTVHTLRVLTDLGCAVHAELTKPTLTRQQQAADVAAETKPCHRARIGKPHEAHPYSPGVRTLLRADLQCAGIPEQAATDQRICVTCEQPIIVVSATGYVHEDQEPGRYDHVAQPKLAHPMDNDPFAGLDDEEN